MWNPIVTKLTLKNVLIYIQFNGMPENGSVQKKHVAGRSKYKKYSCSCDPIRVFTLLGIETFKKRNNLLVQAFYNVVFTIMS